MTQENAATALANVQTTRDRLQQLMLDSVAWSQRIDIKRDHHKFLEDEIISEIWNNPAYKNDKQRNEQKHLAKINDERFVKMRDDMHQLELSKAQCHADILWTQNSLTISTIQYQYALLGGAPGVQLELLPVEKEKADTTTEIVPEMKLHHPVVAEVVIDQPTSLRDRLAASMSVEKIAELTAEGAGELSDADKIRLIEGYKACDVCGKAVDTQVEHLSRYHKPLCSEVCATKFDNNPDNAPYFSTDPAKYAKGKKKDDRPEKIGGIRI